MTADALFSAFADLVIGAAALWAAYVAYCGLHTWRKQLAGGTEYELARRVLKAAITVREAINRIRADFTVDAEGSRQQWSGVAAAWSQLRAEALEAEVVWGKDIHSQIEPLRKLMAKLRSALHRMVRAASDNRAMLDEAAMEALDAVVYDRSTPEQVDDFTRELDAAMDQLIAFLTPHIRA